MCCFSLLPPCPPIHLQEDELAKYRAAGCDAKIASGGGRMVVTMDRYEVRVLRGVRGRWGWRWEGERGHSRVVGPDLGGKEGVMERG